MLDFFMSSLPDQPQPNLEIQQTRNNFLQQLGQLQSRTDTPFTDRPNIKWPDLIDDLQNLINTGSIVTAYQSSTDKIQYGLFRIGKDQKVLAVVLPESADPGFGYAHPDETFAFLAADIYRQHQSTFKGPQRLQYVNAQAHQFTPYSAHYLYDTGKFNLSIRVRFLNSPTPSNQPRTSPSYLNISGHPPQT